MDGFWAKMPAAALLSSAEVCNCKPGVIYYGPRYTNELSTTDSSQWIVATTIEMMIATGLAVGYKPSGVGKCWYEKGFLDLKNALRFEQLAPES